MRLDFSAVLHYWPVFLHGFLLTLAASVLALAPSVALGAAIALGRLSRLRLMAVAMLMLIEAIRDLPFMVILFVMFYLPPAFGLRLPAFWIGVFTLSIYSGVYFAEIIRGAVLSVPRGQMDSARATGMSQYQALRHVVFPQMMGYFLPPATNQAIMLVKDSSVLSTITIAELTMSGRIVMTYTVAPVEIFIIITALYWLICAAVSQAGKRLEARLQQRVRRPNGHPAVNAVSAKAAMLGRACHD